MKVSGFKKPVLSTTLTTTLSTALSAALSAALLAPAVLSLSLLTGHAATAQAEAYIGAGIGSTAYSVDFSALGGGNFEDSATGSKFYGGYGFNDYFALEAAYYNFAEASVGAFELSPGGTVVSMSTSTRAFGAFAVGRYPVTKKVGLFARLGMINWKADLAVNNTSGSNDGNDAAYGIGASYAFTKQLRAVAEWEGFNSDNPELSLFSLGFRFGFK